MLDDLGLFQQIAYTLSAARGAAFCVGFLRNLPREGEHLSNIDGRGRDHAVSTAATLRAGLKSTVREDKSYYWAVRGPKPRRHDFLGLVLAPVFDLVHSGEELLELSSLLRVRILFGLTDDSQGVMPPREKVAASGRW